MAERFKGDENVAEKFAYQQATLPGACPATISTKSVLSSDINFRGTKRCAI
tara:strand:+ start:77 stop:229 length:153 start_codon:yes stop_codon:yes gene_type:complete